MRHFLLFAFASCFVASVGCNAVAAPRIGDKFQTTFWFDGPGGGFTVPLPDGTWTLVGAQRVKAKTDTHEQGAAHDKFMLINSDREKFIGAIRVDGNYELWMPGSTVPTLCTRTNMLHRVAVEANRGRAINCRGLNHHVMSAPNNNTTELGQFFSYAQDKGIKVPRVLLASEYFRASGSKYWSVSYYYNPALDGAKPENPRNWTSSGWNKSHIDSDPERRRIVALRVEWTEKWAPRVEDGFYNRISKNAASQQ